jgi:hypothetical protein
MRATNPQSATSFLLSCLPPEVRAQKHKLINEIFDDYTARLNAKRQADEKRAATINEIESTGENQ